MIGRLRGTLVEKKTQEVLVDVHGVGYEVQMSMISVFQLPPPGEEVILLTHLVVREDAHVLYGFVDDKERELFRVLIRVTGVGPRLALTILSGIESDDFVACVHNNDINTLIRLPGVGRKTAERLVMEARDKLKEWRPEGADGALLPADAGEARGQQEAESALIALGYKPQEAIKAVSQAARRLDEEGGQANVETLIRLALKHLAG